MILESFESADEFKLDDDFCMFAGPSLWPSLLLSSFETLDRILKHLGSAEENRELNEILGHLSTSKDRIEHLMRAQRQ